jgi:hypothetical protein
MRVCPSELAFTVSSGLPKVFNRTFPLKAFESSASAVGFPNIKKGNSKP